MSVFRLAMLPASEGDCLILSYGPANDSLSHVIIDGGREATWPALREQLDFIAARGEEVELLVLSHIDADHIDGLVKLAEAPALPLTPKAIWYNGYEQLKSLEAVAQIQPFGYKAADKYSKALAVKGWPVNALFGGGAIYTESTPDPFTFAGLTFTLLSPPLAKLDRLRKGWRAALNPPAKPITPAGGTLVALGAGQPMPDPLDVEALAPPSSQDTAAANGSSIAMIAEYDGRRVLLGADAHPDAVLAGLNRLAGAGARYAIDLVKLPHHGSRANLTADIIEKLDTGRFAISTSGAVFGHPDPEAISRILKFGTPSAKTLYFNYASERTLPWKNDALQDRYNYRCVFPENLGEPLVIDI